MTHVVGLLLVALAAGGCTSMPTAARAAAPTDGAARIARSPADDLVRRVQDVYQNTPHLTARFHQNVFSKLPAAVLFLGGTDDLSRDFNARLLTGSKHGATGDKVLELTPKKPSAQFETLALVVDPASFRVKKSIVTWATGDSSELIFYQPDTTRRVADTWFLFDP